MEEEISLRELIETIINGKVIIAATTIIAVLISGVLSFFVLTPTYRATATLMVKQPNIQAAPADNPLSILLDSLSQFPMLTMDTFRTQVKNPQVLQSVLDRMDNIDEKMTLETFANKISVNAAQNTNLLEISVADRDPAKAADIANIIAQEFIKFINEQNKQRMSQSSEFLRSQMDVENEKLERAVNQLKEFLAQPPGVDELKQDIEANLAILTSFKTAVVSKEIELEQARASLASALRELENTPRTHVVKKSVIDEPLLSGIIRDSNDKETAELAKLTLETEEINPVYISLSERAAAERINIAYLEAELKGLKREISNISRNLENLQALYAHKKITHDQLEQKVDKRRNTYQAFAAKYEETRIAATAEMGDNTVTIVSQAQIPEVPIAPNKKLNVAVAGVLGLMIGIFTVFFREFWRNSEPKINKINTA